MFFFCKLILILMAMAESNGNQNDLKSEIEQLKKGIGYRKIDSKISLHTN